MQTGVYRTNRRDHRDYDSRAQTEGFQVTAEPKVVYLDRKNHRQVEIPFATLHKLVDKDDPIQVAVYFSMRVRFFLPLSLTLADRPFCRLVVIHA